MQTLDAGSVKAGSVKAVPGPGARTQAVRCCQQMRIPESGSMAFVMSRATGCYGTVKSAKSGGS
jgi:hypothetical protein